LLPDSPNLLFTECRDEPVRADFPGAAEMPLQSSPEPPTRRNAFALEASTTTSKMSGWIPITTLFSRCSATGALAIISKGSDSNGPGKLVVGIWKFPPQRLYATVYSPDKSQGDPSDFDQESLWFLAAKFTAAGLDPKVHIVNATRRTISG